MPINIKNSIITGNNLLHILDIVFIPFAIIIADNTVIKIETIVILMLYVFLVRVVIVLF